MRVKSLYTACLLLMLTFSGLFGIAASTYAEVKIESRSDTKEVHALLIILGNDRYIRESTEKNQSMMVNMLKQLSNDCNVKMTLMKSKSNFEGIITKTTFSNGIGETPQINRQDIIRSEQVAEWLANLKPKSQDTVLIYYTGHGEIKDLDTHYLIFDPVKLDGLLRKEVVKSIQGLQCRLKILITDTDSSGPSVTEPMRDEETNTSVGTVLDQQDVLRHLFLQHEGFLNLTAATEGEHAFANSNFGSHFSYALISTVSKFRDTDADRFASWGEFFSQTRQETMNIFRNAAFPPSMIRDFERLGIEGQRPKYYGQLPKRRD